MRKHFYISLLLVALFAMSAKAQTQVTFYTSMGRFVVEMYDSKAPITSGNFVKLVNEKFYDGVIFHRVIDGFMIQGGDPTGTGSGGSKDVIPDEFDSSLSNIQRTISMANTGPNTGTSQFFINLVDNTYLDFDKKPYTSKHPVFGIVIANFGVVQAIGKVQRNSYDRPLTDVVMDSLRVRNDPGTSIESHDVEAMQVDVYPNPVSEYSSLYIYSDKASRVGITLYDNLGNVVFARQQAVSTGPNTVRLNENGTKPAPGLYQVVVTNGNATGCKKILVLQ